MLGSAARVRTSEPVDCYEPTAIYDRGDPAAGDRCVAHLRVFFAAGADQQHEDDLDPDVRARLEALGYLDSDSSTPGGAP